MQLILFMQKTSCMQENGSESASAVNSRDQTACLHGVASNSSMVQAIEDKE